MENEHADFLTIAEEGVAYMKRMFAILMACTILFSLAACTSQTAEDVSSKSGSAAGTITMESASFDQEVVEEGRSLVVYFSWSGNTEAVAAEIQAQTGADRFKLLPVVPYTDDYETLLDTAQEEKSGQARPAFSGSIENFEQYDTIYLGYPIWWADMPMILYSFLDDYDLQGKTIAPFCTSGGSGLSDTIRTIAALEPDARIVEGLSIGSGNAAKCEDAVTEWLNRRTIEK